MRSLEGAHPSQPTLRDHSMPVASSPSKGSVLVVDDEPMVVRAVSLILERSGYVVRTADGPTAALARFAEAGESIDLLLTDIVMPDGGGRRLAEQLMGRCPKLRVLFMSGFTEHDSVRDDRELAAPLLTKPFSAARLEAAVRKVLDS